MATKNAIDTANPIEVAKGGTGVASTTAYGVILGGTTTTGAFQNAGTGTSAQILQSNGSSAVPTWVAAGATGNLVFLSQQTANNVASINFTSGITSTYKNYMLTISDYFPATNLQNLRMQYSTDGGANYIATSYLSGINCTPYDSITITNTNTTTSFIIMALVENVNAGGSATVWLNNFTSGAGKIRVYGQSSFYKDTAIRTGGNFSGTNTNNSITVNAFTLFSESGNISKGVFNLYGVLP